MRANLTIQVLNIQVSAKLNLIWNFFIKILLIFILSTMTAVFFCLPNFKNRKAEESVNHRY